ncbi:MAG: UDP-glucose/GDP-mannose dehydrogenase [Devosia sp.]|nr:UDP-glucose/GDP-mannose dehydrogenase [Devosia sp.]
MKIVVLGAGYVGLTTSACLADLGHSVTCCDIDPQRIAALQSARVPIFEPGLSELIAQQMQAERLHFTTDANMAANDADAVFLAVGTPSDRDGDIDLSYVETAAQAIAPYLPSAAVIVLKSTVVAGTARRVKSLVDASRGGGDIAVASNPEFLREGTAIKDFLHADRIVIGADDARSEAVLRMIYAPLALRGIPILATETVNAELIKYAANALLALKIGFINDVADLCERLGGDVTAVADGIGRDHRIGGAFLAAGPGFGGSCFPMDTRAFASSGRRHGAQQPLVETLIERNEARKQALAARIIEAAPRHGRVAILGTSFKANTDDVREAAALTIVPLLVAAGLSVHLHDPQPDAAKRLLSNVQWHGTALGALKDADLAVVLTEWDQYRTLDLPKVARAMAGNTLLDLRNIIDPERAAGAGLNYQGLGRAPLAAAPARRGHGGTAMAQLAASPA